MNTHPVTNAAIDMRLGFFWLSALSKLRLVFIATSMAGMKRRVRGKPPPLGEVRFHVFEIIILCLFLFVAINQEQESIDISGVR